MTNEKEETQQFAKFSHIACDWANKGLGSG